jgi:hypothetical protein
VAAQRYDEVRGIDRRRLAVDGCPTKAPLSRSEVVGRNPTDHGKQGVKRSLLVDGKGVPLALVVGPANRNDHLLLADMLDGLVTRRPLRSALVQHLGLAYDDAGSRHGAARRGCSGVPNCWFGPPLQPVVRRADSRLRAVPPRGDPLYVVHIRSRSEEARGRRSGRKRARRWVVERTERPSFGSSVFPWGFGPEDGVEDAREAPHAGDDGDLLGAASRRPRWPSSGIECGCGHCPQRYGR